eukprot:TRINITY_DN962_c0_g1_i1.p1 TRINITY_DN962_c0_g1~~TRINITY_DN962_c0_g1_i1.p1  ORF type:complete len:197 (+),score=27.66 TRINITY_DN962_c0_g1_i1:127-717(+)
MVPHVVNVLQTGNDDLVLQTIRLLEQLVKHNVEVNDTLNNCGLLYFLLTYNGANLNAVASLLENMYCKGTVHQLDTNPLTQYIPLSLLRTLMLDGADAYQTAFLSDSIDSPEVIWNTAMREQMCNAVTQVRTCSLPLSLCMPVRSTSHLSSLSLSLSLSPCHVNNHSTSEISVTSSKPTLISITHTPPWPRWSTRN